MPPVDIDEIVMTINAGSAAENVAPRKIDIRIGIEGLKLSFRLIAQQPLRDR